MNDGSDPREWGRSKEHMRSSHLSKRCNRCSFYSYYVHASAGTSQLIGGEMLSAGSPHASALYGKTITTTHLANWKMSKTNFSILIPFGLSGLISRPCVSTYGIFFWATWCCSWGSYFLREAERKRKTEETGCLWHIQNDVYASFSTKRQLSKFPQKTAQHLWNPKNWINAQYESALLYYVFEEGQGEEVICYVSRVEHQPAIGAALLSGCQGDLTVFNHLITPIHLTDDTHRLCRIGFLHHL